MSTPGSNRNQSPSHLPNGIPNPNAFTPNVDNTRARQLHSMSNKRMSMDSMWKQVEPGLQLVFTMKAMTQKSYMEIYSVVYSYCTSVSPNPDENDPSRAGENLQTKKAKKPTSLPSSSSVESPSHQAAWVGMELYKKLKDFVGNYLVTVVEPLKDIRGETLLIKYSEKWDGFRFSSRVSHGMCMYLNRHWVKRENDEGKNKYIYPIYGLCLVQWRDHVFQPLELQLSRAVLDLISSDRSGETINSQLLRNIIDNFVELGVTTEAEDDAYRKSDKEFKLVGLAVYKSAFEVHFLDETVKFYAHESQNYLSSNPVNEYIKKVQTRLAEEEVRCTKYMHESTGPLLKKTLEDVLIVRHMDIFHAEFVNLLNEEKVEDLALMYNLLCRVPSRIEDLYKLVESHIKAHGGVALAKNVEQLAADPRAFVMAILEVYDRSTKLITGAFKGDHGFSTAMDKAFGSLVNSNAVTEQTKSSAKVSELLARYCDSVLKKSTKNPDELELEESLNRVMIVFRYVEEKDVFQKFYSKMLAKRLVQGLSASDDAEATMISKLKAACGFEYTSKLQRMFQDIGLSRDLNDQFRTHLETNHRSVDCEFAVQVLSTGSWPFSERNNLVLPAELERPVTVFRGFYQQKYNGRKLTWLYNMSRCELSASCFKNKYILQVSTYQAAILLCFNNHDAATVEQLRLTVVCEQPFFSQVLVSLLKAKILLLQDETEDVDERDLEDPEATVKLNMGFKSKKLKINLNVPIRAEQKQEEESTNRVIEEDRKLLIQATIVRIMKMRKQLKHQQLIGEAMQMLSTRFKPNVPIIKKCIEILIQKEYMKRDEENKDMYSYVA